MTSDNSKPNNEDNKQQVDLSTLSPEVRDYIGSLRMEGKERRIKLKAAEKELGTLKEKLAVLESKVPAETPPAPAPKSAREMSRDEYRRAKGKALRDLRRQRFGEKPADQKPETPVNARQLDREAYKAFKAGLTRGHRY